MSAKTLIRGACLCLLAITACTSAVNHVDGLTAVAPANALLDSAYRRGDAAAVASLLTDSVVMSAENIPDLVGRATMRDIMTQFFGSNRVHAFTLRPTEVMVFGDRAFERGTFFWSAGAKGAEPVSRNGRYFALRIRGADGVWRIHRYIENCLPAPCPS